MRNLLIIWKIFTEKNFGKSKKKIDDFFFASDFFFKIFFFRKCFFNFFFLFRTGMGGERSERRGVGERNEPPAGGLAVGAEGPVNLL